MSNFPVSEGPDYDVIIVGAGPAGSSSAIHLANLRPKSAHRVLLLDKAVFPRPKLCAGGVTSSADVILTQLGGQVAVPTVSVHTSRFMLPSGSLTLKQDDHFMVVSREAFDDYLFRTAKNRGVVTRDGEGVESLSISSDGVVVRTAKGTYKASLVIGADGANSRVRRSMGMSRSTRLMMAMEVTASLADVRIPELTENTAVFDFSITLEGIPGYCWIFPSHGGHAPRVSLGIIDSSFNEEQRVPLKETFLDWLGDVVPNLKSYNLRAHPAIRYEPRASCSQYRVLLSGDAVGVDPLFGEGITSALALGMIAAQSANDALVSNDFSFSDYRRRIHSSPIGSMMRRRRVVARRLYKGYMPGRRMDPVELLNWITPISSNSSPITTHWEPVS